MIVTSTYLSTIIHLIGAVLALLFWVLDFYFLFFLLMFVYACLIYTFRKVRPLVNKQKDFDDGSLIFSPVNGKVVSIQKKKDHFTFGKNLIEVHLRMSFLDEYGIYSPFNSEVQKAFFTKGESVFRYKENSFSLNQKALCSRRHP